MKRGRHEHRESLKGRSCVERDASRLVCRAQLLERRLHCVGIAIARRGECPCARAPAVVGIPPQPRMADEADEEMRVQEPEAQREAPAVRGCQATAVGGTEQFLHLVVASGRILLDRPKHILREFTCFRQPQRSCDEHGARLVGGATHRDSSMTDFGLDRCGHKALDHVPELLRHTEPHVEALASLDAQVVTIIRRTWNSEDRRHDTHLPSCDSKQ
mmetsp:Transcript_46902/g.130608  ORF Transcript_46902/g.130608 Transcript_46902/m.130608 type:complete len:216 (+) Transcript_46902:2564-3211(+)